MSELDVSTPQNAGPSTGDNGTVYRVAKRTRQTQSCDACRRRKVRCDRNLDSTAPCSNCRMIDETCAFTRPQKKRGPLERMPGTPRIRGLATNAPSPGLAPPPPPPPPHTGLDPESSFWNALGTIPRQPQPEYPVTPASAIRDDRHLASTINPSAPRQTVLADRSLRLLPDSPTTPSPGYPAFPHNPNNVFDNILPRGLLYLIIDHFFDYIYPLNPVIHRPSFIKDIQDGREQRLGEEEWIAVVMTVLAVTILQLPPAFLPVSVDEARRIAVTCYRYAKGFQTTDYHNLSLDRQTSLLLMGTCTSFLGQKEAAAVHRLAIVGSIEILRLHEEYSYASYPPIEREMRRRIYWISYGGDQTLALMQAAPCSYHVDENDTELPLKIDDEFLSDDGNHTQPPDHAPVIAGFHHNVKIFRYAAHVLECRRRDRRHAPVGEALKQRLAEVEGLYKLLTHAMDDCPEHLKLGPARSPESEMRLQSSLEGYYRSGSKMSPARDAFLVQQANIYVTQHTYRYLTLEYLQQLYALNDIAVHSPTAYHRTIFTTGNDVAEDLLTTLHSLPIEAIAVNSLPIVMKVRYVACTLLDAEDTSNLTSPAGGEPNASPRVKRAETALLDFVDILAKLDKINRITEGW